MTIKKSTNPSAKSLSLSNSLLAFLLLVLLIAPLGGCGLLGEAPQDARLHTIPPKQRLLILVDPRPDSGMPIDAPAQLTKLLDEHLFAYKVEDSFVDPNRLVELRKNPDFAKMGIADIAALTDADIVLYVDVQRFNVETQSEGEMTQGDAVATVKIVDKKGKRLWPPETEVLGYEVESHVAPALAETASVTNVKQQLLDDLNIRIGRIFHSYDKEDTKMGEK